MLRAGDWTLGTRRQVRNHPGPTPQRGHVAAVFAPVAPGDATLVSSLSSIGAEVQAANIASVTKNARLMS
jgi:hypothetical protein